ncbi:hypothetical protein [Dietzia sp. B32]|nr:hypothetical protein [Dietzia sp. B32]UVE96572.1 hypothetical protein L8M95_07365 [Dietzia sp. B32]
MGSITDLISSGSGESGSSTGTITDQIAETVGDLVATALKSVLGNLS